MQLALISFSAGDPKYAIIYDKVGPLHRLKLTFGIHLFVFIEGEVVLIDITPQKPCPVPLFLLEIPPTQSPLR